MKVIPLELQLQEKLCIYLVKLWNEAGQGSKEVVLKDHFYLVSMGLLIKHDGRDTHMFTELGKQAAKFLSLL